MKRIKMSVVQAALGRLAGFVRDTKTGNWIAGKTAGVGVTVMGAKILLSFLGIQAVAHSSSATILTAGSGYIAGTMGFGAAIVGFLSWVLVIPLFVLCVAVGLFAVMTGKKEVL